MKMKPITITVFVGCLIVLICAGCKTISMKDINPESRPNARLLPYLVPIVDTNNIQTIYTSGVLVTKTSSGTTTTPYNDNSGKKGYSQGSSASSDSASSSQEISRRADLRVGDVVSIFTKEVEQNIVDLNTAANPRGYIVLRLNGRASNGNAPLELVSTLTLGTLCFLGIPGDQRTEELDIDVAIYNNAGVLVRQYTESGIDTETIAMYYGYTELDAARLSAAQALKKALEQVRSKIYRDYDQIASKL